MGYQQDIEAMERVVELVEDKPSTFAVYAIVSRATEVVKAQADPASVAGQALLSTLLFHTAWNILRSGSVCEQIRVIANKLNAEPAPKKSE